MACADHPVDHAAKPQIAFLPSQHYFAVAVVWVKIFIPPNGVQLQTCSPRHVDGLDEVLGQDRNFAFGGCLVSQFLRILLAPTVKIPLDEILAATDQQSMGSVADCKSGAVSFGFFLLERRHQTRMCVARMEGRLAE